MGSLWNATSFAADIVLFGSEIRFWIHTWRPDLEPPKLTRGSQTSLVSHELQVNIFYIECSGAVC